MCAEIQGLASPCVDAHKASRGRIQVHADKDEHVDADKDEHVDADKDGHVDADKDRYRRGA